LLENYQVLFLYLNLLKYCLMFHKVKLPERFCSIDDPIQKVTVVTVNINYIFYIFLKFGNTDSFSTFISSLSSHVSYNTQFFATIISAFNNLELILNNV